MWSLTQESTESSGVAGESRVPLTVNTSQGASGSCSATVKSGGCRGAAMGGQPWFQGPHPQGRGMVPH